MAEKLDLLCILIVVAEPPPMTTISHEEAAEVQAQCNDFGVPLLGIYCGVEIAPFLGKSRGLDWSGVFVVFAE